MALDNDYAIWKAFNNQYWPAHYFIDAAGRIRGHHFGEGDYAESEQLLRQLLTEAGATHLPADTGGAAGTGVEAASDQRQVSSPETYVGYERAANFASSGGEVADRPHAYAAPHAPQLNQWGLSGSWRVEAERAVATSARAGIVFRFRARDLHLVLGPPDAAHAIRFRVTVDGHAPGDDHGSDVKPRRHGNGHRAAPVPAAAPGGRSRRAHVRDRIPRPRSAGVLFYLRLMENGAMKRADTYLSRRTLLRTGLVLGAAAAAPGLVRAALLAAPKGPGHA